MSGSPTDHERQVAETIERARANGVQDRERARRQAEVALYDRLADRTDGLTDAEGVAMDALNEAARAYGVLPVQHPDETREFIDAIHRAQNVLAVRIARRAYPKGWPTYE